MTKPLRQAMPFTAGIIDDFRANWPEAGVVQAVRAGIDGQPVFYSRENSHQIGTPIPYEPNKAVRLSDIDRTPNTLTSAQQTEKKGPRRG